MRGPVIKEGIDKVFRVEQVGRTMLCLFRRLEPKVITGCTTRRRPSELAREGPHNRGPDSPRARVLN